MKKSELENLIREQAIEEGFWDKVLSKRANQARNKVLKKKGLVKSTPDPDVSKIPGGSEVDKKTGKTYAELVKIWVDTGNATDYRGRAVAEIPTKKTKKILSIEELSQLLTGAGKV